MILVDTNVVSELLKQAPDPQVWGWATALDEPTALSTITSWELLYGVGRLPQGGSKDRLAAAIERVLADAHGRLFDFDAESARHAAAVRVDREALGRPIATADAMIAGICLRHDAALSTRNVRDFEGLGIRLINPWE